MNALNKVENFISAIEKTVMNVVGLLLPAIITVGVFFRYVLKIDLYAIEEIEVFLAIIFYFAGSAYASYKESQITADILQCSIKSFKARKIIAIIATFATFIISLCFTYWCTDMIHHAWLKSPRTSVWKLPLIAEYIVVFLCMILMTVYALRDFIKACKRTEESDAAIREEVL